jgi:hypothetical protein
MPDPCPPSLPPRHRDARLLRRPLLLLGAAACSTGLASLVACRSVDSEQELASAQRRPRTADVA